MTLASIGTASYNSLQVGVGQRFSHGLKCQSNFSWAKTIDLAGSGIVSLGAPQVPNPFNIRFNRGVSLLNFPCVSVSHLVYTTPELQGMGHDAGLLGVCELSGIVTLQSGQPFGISGGNGNNNSGSLQFGDCADVVPGVSLNVH